MSKFFLEDVLTSVFLQVIIIMKDRFDGNIASVNHHTGMQELDVCS